MKHRVKEVIVVEGRYDKNTLSQILDATIVETGGFAIFKDKERQTMLRSLAERRGLIVLTDSDGGGLVIRNFLRGILPAGQVKDAYIPDVFGKERRKSSPSKEGKLGVEGMEPGVIMQALRRCGATIDDCDEELYSGNLSKADLYSLGLSGGENSAANRRLLQKKLGLPEKMSANSLLAVLNVISTKKELLEILSDGQE